MSAQSSPCLQPWPVLVGRVGKGAGNLSRAMGVGKVPWPLAGCGMSAGEVVRWDLEAVWAAVLGIPPPPCVWDWRSHPASSAGTKCFATGRDCQGAGCGAGVVGGPSKRREGLALPWRRVVGLEHPRAERVMAKSRFFSSEKLLARTATWVSSQVYACARSLPPIHRCLPSL